MRHKLAYFILFRARVSTTFDAFFSLGFTRFWYKKRKGNFNLIKKSSVQPEKKSKKQKKTNY